MAGEADAEEAELEAEIAKLDRKDSKLIARFKSMFGKAAADTRQKAMVFKALVLVAKAVRWSQDAEKLYWSQKDGKARSDADFDKAERMLQEGVRMIDSAMSDQSPGGMAMVGSFKAFMPLREKLLIQLKDIQYQRLGVVKSQEELKEEVNRG